MCKYFILNADSLLLWWSSSPAPPVAIIAIPRLAPAKLVTHIGEVTTFRAERKDVC
jgi:hypothetical protein